MDQGPQPDPRIGLFTVLGPDGARSLFFADLGQQAEGWPVAAGTREGVAGLLSTARATYALAAYH